MADGPCTHGFEKPLLGRSATEPCFSTVGLPRRVVDAVRYNRHIEHNVSSQLVPKSMGRSDVAKGSTVIIFA